MSDDEKETADVTQDYRVTLQLYADTEPAQRVEKHFAVQTYSAPAAFDAVSQWLHANYMKEYAALDAAAFDAVCRSPTEPVESVDGGSDDGATALAAFNRAKCREAYRSIKVYTHAEWARDVASRCEFIHFASAAADVDAATVPTTIAAAAAAAVAGAAAVSFGQVVASSSSESERKSRAADTRQLYRCMLTAERKVPDSPLQSLAALAGVDLCAAEQGETHLVCYSTSLAQALVLLGCWLGKAGGGGSVSHKYIVVSTEHDWWAYDASRCLSTKVDRSF